MPKLRSLIWISDARMLGLLPEFKASVSNSVVHERNESVSRVFQLTLNDMLGKSEVFYPVVNICVQSPMTGRKEYT